MPDENRSEQLPFDSRNEPPLQRAVLLFLLAEQDTWHTFDSLVEKGGFGEHDERALRSAVKSLRSQGLILLSRKEEMAASAGPRHFHWLMTEVEPLDG
jgi:hypothetical protein